MLNKFKATWVSNSSISDFLKCPKSYYLKNVYKTNDGKKISIVSPYLSLGITVHNVLEPFAEIPVEKRATTMFGKKFFSEWEKVSGEKGGFDSIEQEEDFKQRGVEILTNVRKNIHHLLYKTVFLEKKRTDLPFMWLSEEEEIVLCGKTDFLMKKNGTYEVLDFKTNFKLVESDDSLQLPIYSVLLNHYLGADDVKTFYWYVGLHPDPVEKKLPSVEESKNKILELAKMIKRARMNKEFDCPHGGCVHCEGLSRIVNGEGKFVGLNEYGGKMFKL